MRALLLVPIVVLASCKQVQPPDAGTTPAALKSPLDEVPKSDGVLSLFVPMNDRCQWRRVDGATGKETVVAAFPGSCVGAQVAWAADGLKAAVWFNPRLVQSAGIGGPDVGAPGYADETADPAAKDRFYEVTVRTHEVHQLPNPKVTIDELGLDAKRHVIALSLETLSDAAVAEGKTTVDGKDLVLEKVDEGQPALAHAWRASDVWDRIETVQTTTGWDYGPGVSALKAASELGPRSSTLLDTHPEGAKEVEDAVLAKLKPLQPANGDGSWSAFGTPGSRVFAWLITAEFAHTTGLIVFESGTLARATKPGFTDGELVALRLRGPFVLMSSGHAGSHPRLYDTRTKALLYSSDTARAVTFWP